MRRVLSILLLLVIGFPLIAPAYGRGVDAGVPACCRRGGAHHCMGMAAPGVGPQMSTLPCSAFPRANAVLVLHPVSGAPAQSSLGLAGVQRSAGKAQTEARFRIAFSRSGQKRGPPTILD